MIPRVQSLIVFCLIAGVVACSSRPAIDDVAAAPEVIKSQHRFAREYVITPGDRIEVAVYQHADVYRSVTVQADGFISIPLLDQVQIAGLTMPEADAKLTGLLSRRLRDPEVTIILLNAVEPMVYVIGDVGVVKPVPLRSARTVAQALANTGGVTRDGARKSVALIRLHEDGFFRTTYIADDSGSQVEAYLSFYNTPLLPEDLIVVPESSRSKGTRFLQDFVINPLTAFNQALNPFFQYRLIDLLED